jgi:hypothetical protein
MDEVRGGEHLFNGAKLMSQCRNVQGTVQMINCARSHAAGGTAGYDD